VLDFDLVGEEMVELFVRFEVSTAVTMMIIIFWEKSHTVSSPRR
jgi:uncharacterized protein YbcI